MAARASARRARKQSPTWWKWTKRSLAVLLLCFLIASTVFCFLFMEEMNKAKTKISNLTDLMAEVEKKPSFIYSADNKILYQISAEYRQPVSYEAIPKNVRNAILAAEDKRFFEHSGVDYYALGRTLFTTVKSRSISQGGSTLTMQLAKILYTNSERTFQRKLGDIAMAVTIEKQLMKEQIFELYANKVYFGSGAYGIQAASEVYFGKKIDKLTIGEAALLARLVRRPSDQNPFRNPEKAIENRDVVLRIMLDEKMISQDEYDKAIAEKPKFAKHNKGISEQFNEAKYFVWHVLDVLHETHPEIHLDEGNYKIYTTLDTQMQKVAEDAVHETVRDHRGDKVTTAAFIAMDSGGKVLCEVGGVDFNRNQYNVVKDGQRQPGSSFKPFVYATAFATGAVSINDSISNERFTWDIPGSSRGWTVHNSNNKYGGMVSIPTAFKWSMNVPAARVMEKTGPNNVLAYCRNQFGFTSDKLVGNPSMCLGAEEVSPLEMAQAYSVFMLRGNRAKPYVITRIVGPDGTDVQPNGEGPSIVPSGLDPNVTDQIDALMRSVVVSGTGTRAGIVPDARGKTGTTSDNKDAWFCGYTDGIVGIGWVANEVLRPGKTTLSLPMGRSVFGGKVTVEFWAQIMKYAQKRFGRPMERPSMASILGSSRPSENAPEDTPTDLPIPPDNDGADPAQDPTMGPRAGNPPTTDPGTGHDLPPTVPPPTTDPDKTPPVKPPTDPPREREEDMVSVDVCAETGMRASIYCPETVTRKFPKGKEPKKRCTKHGG